MKTERLRTKNVRMSARLAAKLRVAVQEYEDCDIDAETFALILADVERLGRAS